MSEFFPIPWRKQEEEDVLPENQPKQKCKYCGHLFRPWLLPASGEHAIACAFCSIIAIHLFNKQPMPQWLLDYQTMHDMLSEREYSEAVRHLQNLLLEALPNPPPDSFGREIRDSD